MHNINFKCTQTFRLIIFVTSLLIWLMMLYVWGKAIFGQIVFYTMSVFIYAMTTISVSAGREVVEEKMLEKLKEKRRCDPKETNREAIDEMELPVEEKSGLWKYAVTSYAIGAPLVLTVPIIFGIFWDKMIMGEVCKFYSLTSPDSEETQDMTANQIQQYCIDNYDTIDFVSQTGFRYYMFMAALFLPVFFLILEYSFNQLLIPKRQFFYQIVFCLLYMAATYLFTKDGQILFPNLVNAACDAPECMWSEFFFFHLVLIAVTQLCFWILVFAHYAKVKFCCRRSVSIVYQPLVAASQVSITAKQR